MASHALSDDQVASELRKMVQFIKQEASEKAREVQIKADEDFAIEKAKIVRSECSLIDQQYNTKIKQAGLAQEIKKSNISNKTRLEILSSRDQVIDKIFDDANEKLKKVQNDKKVYKGILVGLILEGLYILLEKDIKLRVRKSDIDSVLKSIPDAKEKYKSETGRDVNIEIVKNDFISDKSTGGLVIIGGAGKIEVTNTFEERLKLLSEGSLPAIRYTVFG